MDSGLVIPCCGKDGLLNIIILGQSRTTKYTPMTISLLSGILSYATSLAIESCTYWKELEERTAPGKDGGDGPFSYSVAHEIDNPMAIIKGNGEYLRRHFLKKSALARNSRKTPRKW